MSQNRGKYMYRESRLVRKLMQTLLFAKGKPPLEAEQSYTLKTRFESKIMDSVKQETTDNGQRDLEGAITGSWLSRDRSCLKCQLGTTVQLWDASGRDLRFNHLAHRTRNGTLVLQRISMDRRIILDRSTFHGVAWRDCKRGWWGIPMGSMSVHIV